MLPKNNGPRILLSKASPLLGGRRCHQHLRPRSQDSAAPCPARFPGWGGGESPCPRPLPSESPSAAWARQGCAREARCFGKQVVSRSRGAEVRLLLPAQSSPGAFRAASLGEIGAFHLGQLCKQVPQCFKGTFSCDFSQFKKKKMDTRVKLK